MTVRDRCLFLIANAFVALVMIARPASAYPCPPDPDAAVAGDTAAYLFGSVDEADARKCLTYFRNQARLWLKPEQRLANGVSWRLLVDAHTDMRMPRITWMPDRDALLRANRMFDVLHGAGIANARSVETIWRANYAYRIEMAKKLGQVIRPWAQYFSFRSEYHQDDVALTYASSHFVSYREFGSGNWSEGSGGGAVIVKGQVFDLEHGTYFGVDGCPEDPGASYGTTSGLDRRWEGLYWDPAGTGPDRHLFTFGSLLHLCDEERYAAFRTLLVKHANAAIPAADRTPSPEIPYCTSWAKKLAALDLPIVPVVTLSGLAMYAFNRGGAEEYFRLHCPSGAAGAAPVVIPYTELAPLMTSGPLRDELLALPGVKP